MKPFSLDEYLKNPSRKVVTRDGRNARVVCTDKKGRYPVAALVEDYNGDSENVFAFTKDGRYYGGELNEKGLFFVAPEKHEGWIVLCRDADAGIMNFGTAVFPSREQTEDAGKRDCCYLTVAKIEWEE